MADDSFQVFLSTKDCTNFAGGLTSCPEYYIPPIEVGSNCYLFVSIVQASIPNSLYQIDKTNNYLEYRIFGETKYFNIIPGNYNASTLQAALDANTELNFNYDSIRNIYYISHFLNDFHISDNSTCLSLLGLSKKNLISKNQLLKSDMCVNLLAKNCVCIHSTLQSGNIGSYDFFDNTLLQTIPIAVQPFGMITFVGNRDNRTCIFNNTIQYIGLSLRDADNNIIDLNGCNWCITLQFDIVAFN